MEQFSDYLSLLGQQIPHEKKWAHFHQMQTFTLATLATYYMARKAQYEGGIYLIRVETPLLAQKMIVRAKNKFVQGLFQSLCSHRKHRFHQSIFYLDFFQLSSWHLTEKIPLEKIKGILVIKESCVKVFQEEEGDQDKDLYFLSKHVGAEVPLIFLVSPLFPIGLSHLEEIKNQFTPVEFPFSSPIETPLFSVTESALEKNDKILSRLVRS